MPRLSAVDVIKNLLAWLKLAQPKDAQEGALRFETLHYSPTGSETLPRRLAAQLAKFPNLRSTGRQGAFAYPNMHTAMRMGQQAAEELIAHDFRH